MFTTDWKQQTPFDPRLIVKIAPAVARAAMVDGVGSRPIYLNEYARSLVRLMNTDSANPMSSDVQARSR